MGDGNNLNRSEPVVDFTSMDAEAVLADVKAYARATFTDKWTDFEEGQLGWIFGRVMAYHYDLGSFYLNALIGETLLHAALDRQARIDIAKKLDYAPSSATSASVSMRCTINPLAAFPFTIAALTDSVSNGATDEVVFSPVSDVTVAALGPGYVDVDFVEGVVVDGEALGTSSGLPNQRFVLANADMVDGTLVVTVNGIQWALAAHQVEQTATQESYLIARDANENVVVVFGDGTFGKIPVATHAIEATYRYGGGRRGNLAHDTITTIRSMPAEITAVTNPAASSGGGPRTTTAHIARAATAGLNAHSGLINDADIADGAVTVPTVAKARAFPEEGASRTVRLVVAPSGGGVPTATLRNTIQSSLQPYKMVNMRFSVEAPVYKDAEMTLVVYAGAGAKRTDVRNLVMSMLTNADGDGYLDFDQLDFAGVDPETGDPFMGESAIQRLFDNVDRSLIRRVQIEKMTVRAAARPRRVNAGNGTVAVTANTNDNRRREYLIRFSSSTSFRVYERIVGKVGRVEPYAIEDESKDFGFETFGSDLVTAGYTLINPNRRQSTVFTTASNTTSRFEATTPGLSFVAEPGDDYYVQKTLAGGLTGVDYEVVDPETGLVLVTWNITPGTTPFSTADELIIDTFPPLGDIVLRDDEYPQIAFGDITVRIVGGVSS